MIWLLSLPPLPVRKLDRYKKTEKEGQLADGMVRG
jgi:hypothetical protein